MWGSPLDTPWRVLVYIRIMWFLIFMFWVYPMTCNACNSVTGNGTTPNNRSLLFCLSSRANLEELRSRHLHILKKLRKSLGSHWVQKMCPQSCPYSVIQEGESLHTHSSHPQTAFRVSLTAASAPNPRNVDEDNWTIPCHRWRSNCLSQLGSST